MLILRNILLSLFIITTLSCQKEEEKKATENNKIAVLLVNHGSVSKNWRSMLEDLEKSTREEILKIKSIGAVRTAFMEYTEPSIATQMKYFDKMGYKEVIVVPLFLTISSHSEGDIPTILGLKNNPEILASLKKEKIETYRAKARVTIAPNLDYPTFLKKNILRRYKALAPKGKKPGVVLVAYGDKDYDQQWKKLVKDIGKYLKNVEGVKAIAYSWCGHLVGYSKEPTKKAITQVLAREKSAVVIPILVAVDEYFQNDIIQGAVDTFKKGKNVLYKQDAVLPDNNLRQWIIEIIRDTSKTL